MKAYKTSSIDVANNQVHMYKHENWWEWGVLLHPDNPCKNMKTIMSMEIIAYIMDHTTLSKIAINGNWSYKSAVWAFLHKKEKPCTLFISHRHKKFLKKCPLYFSVIHWKFCERILKTLWSRNRIFCPAKNDGMVCLPLYLSVSFNTV